MAKLIDPDKLEELIKRSGLTWPAAHKLRAANEEPEEPRPSGHGAPGQFLESEPL